MTFSGSAFFSLESKKGRTTPEQVCEGTALQVSYQLFIKGQMVTSATHESMTFQWT